MKKSKFRNSNFKFLINVEFFNALMVKRSSKRFKLLKIPISKLIQNLILKIRNYFTVPKHTKARYHLFGVAVGSFCITVTLILTGYNIYRHVFALTESAKQMPVDVAFNRELSGTLAGYANGSGTISVLSSEVRLATSSGYRPKSVSWLTKQSW